MLRCWACDKALTGIPDEFIDPEGEEEPDIVSTCPKCLTRHVYTEAADGNLFVSQAVRLDGSVLHGPRSRHAQRPPGPSAHPGP